MVILAIDTSLTSSGYCIGDDKGNIIKYGKVATDKKDFKDEETRMNHISNIFDDLIITQKKGFGIVLPRP